MPSARAYDVVLARKFAGRSLLSHRAAYNTRDIVYALYNIMGRIMQVRESRAAHTTAGRAPCIVYRRRRVRSFSNRQTVCDAVRENDMTRNGVFQSSGLRYRDKRDDVSLRRRVVSNKHISAHFRVESRFYGTKTRST